MKHQAVPVGIGKDRAVANAGVERLASELDAGLLELLLGRVDVRDTNRERPERKRRNSLPISSGTTIASVRFPVSNSTQRSDELGLRVSPSVSP
ncbi:MAG: hypothetical protein WD380_00145 [Gaiellaceae bacterium]